MDEPIRAATRRAFLAVGAATALASQAAGGEPDPDPDRDDQGPGPARPAEPVEVPTMKAKTEAQSGPPPAPSPPETRLGFAIVGLGELGTLRMIEASNGQNQGPVDQWRHNKTLAGGGSLPDVGIYCLNAARSITAEEPVRVAAQVETDGSDPRFREVEDRMSFQLWFPSGVFASCRTFDSAHESRRCRVLGESGWIDLDPAFAYRGLRMKASQARDRAELTTEVRLPEKNQFALEMDHMARRVAKGERPDTPGEEGLQDMKIIEALYRAAREEKPVELKAPDAQDATRGPAPED